MAFITKRNGAMQRTRAFIGIDAIGDSRDVVVTHWTIGESYCREERAGEVETTKLGTAVRCVLSVES